MGWLERAGTAVGRGLMRVAGALLALGILIGVWVYLGSNQSTFNAVVDSAGDFASTAIVSGLDWGTEQMGGSASTAQQATAEPKTLWVENKAPARWPVKQAVAEWNKDLTSVQLKVGKCPSRAVCIRVSQDEVYTPAGEPLVLGRTATLFGTRVTFNAKAAGQPASYRLFTACHELGHALGLDHDQPRGSCMHASARGAATRPAAADYAAVNEKYSR
jgi:hypothetical protein